MEKVKFKLTLPASVKRLKYAEGAIDELLKLFDELAAEPESRVRLATELSDLEKKLPRELKEGADPAQREQQVTALIVQGKLDPFLHQLAVQLRFLPPPRAIGQRGSVEFPKVGAVHRVLGRVHGIAGMAHRVRCRWASGRCRDASLSSLHSEDNNPGDGKDQKDK